MKTPMSRLPGISTLVADYFDHFAKVAEFYNGDYRNPEDFSGRSDSVRTRKVPLGQLVTILKEQNQRFGCGSQTLEKIDLLLEGRACAVVTGQQTGLFGGPLLTVYKALTTIKLAARLNRTCEGCYVPIFWLASDDHDFREVNHVILINKSNQPVTVSYAGHPVEAKIPVSEIELSDEITAVFQQLDQETHPSEFKEEVFTRLADAYRAKMRFSSAFGVWLTALFKSFGLVLIDASDPRIKVLGKSVFQTEITVKSPSTRRALAASAQLVEKNYHTQVRVHEGMLNLFYLEKSRNAIEMVGDKFAIKGLNRNFDENELLAQVEKQPQLFSPNVLLRPIYQDALLPTVAYVAGPAEIAYYAQMKGIYESFAMPMPIIYPRKSLTLLENKIDKVLDNYGLRVGDFWGDAERLINRIAKEQLPDSLEKRIENATKGVDKNLQTLEKVVMEFEPTLGHTVENAKGKIVHQMESLEKKILQAYKKRNEVIVQQIHKAEHSLYPKHHLQERKLNILPYLFKYGFGFIDRLYEAIDISSFEHQVIRI